ncbi:hypothetical protein [Tenacibaculum sp. 190524A02b]|uniref:Uncharacterized protein n=1 Tax=Tenacibaculum vairaonense TaxID=3137860 RepID=A0ABM9PK81_9FLAO
MNQTLIKDLLKVQGVEELSKSEKMEIGGGRSWDCKYENPDGSLHTVTYSSTANAIANCDNHRNCRGCS